MDERRIEGTMATAIRVEAAVPGRRKAGTAEHPIEIDLAPGSVALRSLSEAVLRAEAAAVRRRSGEQTFVRLLIEAPSADGEAAGTAPIGGRVDADDRDVDRIVAAAMLAHREGIYQVQVDDQPVYELDSVVTLGDDTRLLFLRLVPLADA